MTLKLHNGQLPPSTGKRNYKPFAQEGPRWVGASHPIYLIHLQAEKGQIHHIIMLYQKKLSETMPIK